VNQIKTLHIARCKEADAMISSFILDRQQTLSGKPAQNSMLI